MDDIERFIECGYTLLSAKLYHTCLPFPLPNTWYDTLSHCGLSGQLHTDAMSTACNCFTAPPGDVAQQWTAAITHQAILHARQEHTTWLVTPMLQDVTLYTVVSTSPTPAPPKRASTRFKHGAMAQVVSDFCAIAANNRSIRGILLLPTSCTLAHTELHEFAETNKGSLTPLSSPLPITAVNRAARLNVPADDQMAQFWMYELCDMRANRPLSATMMVATLGQHVKHLNAKLLSQDVTPLYTRQAQQHKAALNP